MERLLIEYIEVQPGTKLSTLDEVFDFVECSTDEPVLFNIESKINPVMSNETRSAGEFVAAMGEIFVKRGEEFVKRITHQSFDVSRCPCHHYLDLQSHIQPSPIYRLSNQ
jgi:hypothetical protein